LPRNSSRKTSFTTPSKLSSDKTTTPTKLTISTTTATTDNSPISVFKTPTTTFPLQKCPLPTPPPRRRRSASRESSSFDSQMSICSVGTSPTATPRRRRRTQTSQQQNLRRSFSLQCFDVDNNNDDDKAERPVLPPKTLIGSRSSLNENGKVGNEFRGNQGASKNNCCYITVYSCRLPYLSLKIFNFFNLYYFYDPSTVDSQS
jgi:hypothetical protein